MHNNNNNNNNNKDQVLDLREFAYVVFKNIWLVILLAIVGFVGFYIFAKNTEVPTYTSSVSLYVKNTTNKTTMDSVSAGDLTAAQTIAGTYIAVLEDDVVMETIGNKLLEKYSAEELSNYFLVVSEDGELKIDEGSIKSKINIEQVNETELLKISATTTSPVISADICTFITEYAPEQLIRVVGAGSVETVGRIKVPKYSNGSRVGKTAAAGLLGGIILAFLILYFRYTFDNTINNSEVLKVKYDLPVLSEIPYYDVEGNGNKKPKKTGFIAQLKFRHNKNNGKIEKSVRSTIKDVKVPFIVTEAYNTLRTNMLFALSTNKNSSNIAVVSSSVSGEGKSTSVANLAISFGETDAKVLLIDGDLRKPTQHKLFKIKNEKGLSTLLSGMTAFKDTVNKNVVGNLDVITSGPIPPNPSQMYTSENMNKLLEQVSAEYDYVLVDTSPVNIVSDALLLSKKTAGIIFVIRQGITTFEQVERVIESVNFAGSSILGVVINSVDPDVNTTYKKGSYTYKYNYKYFYGANNDNDSDKDDNKAKSNK